MRFRALRSSDGSGTASRVGRERGLRFEASSLIKLL